MHLYAWQRRNYRKQELQWLTRNCLVPGARIAVGLSFLAHRKSLNLRSLMEDAATRSHLKTAAGKDRGTSLSLTNAAGEY